MAKPVVNDLEAMRRIAYPGHGERPATNPILQLCAEVEQLRATNAALAQQLARAGDLAVRLNGGGLTTGERMALMQQLADACGVQLEGGR